MSQNCGILCILTCAFLLLFRCWVYLVTATVDTAGRLNHKNLFQAHTNIDLCYSSTTLKEHIYEIDFFYRFGICPFHNCYRLFDFGFKFEEIFKIKNWLPQKSTMRGAAKIALKPPFSNLSNPLGLQNTSPINFFTNCLFKGVREPFKNSMIHFQENMLEIKTEGDSISPMRGVADAPYHW